MIYTLTLYLMTIVVQSLSKFLVLPLILKSKGLFLIHAVPTFDSCNKCVGSTGIIHNRPVSGYDCMDNLTTEHGFNSQATWIIKVLGLIF